jgi:hypothetical protein
MGMLLVRKTPFPSEELAMLRRAAEQLRFDVDLEPGAARTPLLRVLATGQGSDPELSGRIDYSAPTDDQPFFFNLHRLATWTLGREHMLHQEPALLVVDLLMGVSLLALLCIALPFAFATTAFRRGDFPFLAFFAAIGAGFMLIEIAMLQRLIIFLGHPIYSLSVILFVLLLAGGIGARLSARVAAEDLRTKGVALLALLTAVVAVAGVVIAPLTAHFQSAETPLRIAVSAALLGVMGIFMGAAFPLGMRLASTLRAELTPWLWAVNGATSVVASVLAVVVAMAWGISTSFWAGVASYLLAAAAFALAARRVAR